MKKFGLMLVVAVQAQVFFPDEIITIPSTTLGTSSVAVQDSSHIPIAGPNNSSTSAIVFPDSSSTSSTSKLNPITPPTFPSQCGESFSERIIGGSASGPGEWPWLAALGTKQGSNFHNICGGTLITHRHVLSAQHCFSNHITPDTVRLGEYDLRRTDDIPFGYTKDFGIAQRLSKGYNPRTYENDIVILVLDDEVYPSYYIQPVCLPLNDREKDFSAESLAVVGWGKTNFKTESYTDVPQNVLLPVVDTDFCASKYHRLGGSIRPVIDERSLCAGNGTKDSCNGDSGGPLLYLSLSDGRYYLAGIVSFGYECANAEYPGVYTRITSFLDWIVNTVQIN